MKSGGKTIALIYGDFGNQEVAPVAIELLEILESVVELILDNLRFRKKLAPPAAG
jgi:hypothetical protein